MQRRTRIWLFQLIIIGSFLFFTNSCKKDDIKLPPLRFGSMSDIEGNSYKTIQIGNQTWMAENLKSTIFNDNTNIPLVTDDTEWSNLTSPGYCWYNNDTGNKAVYGALYNWYAINTGKLCPAGWHIPSYAEWAGLEDFLVKNGYGFGGNGNLIAKSLAARDNWAPYSDKGAPGNDPASNNSCGFSGLPGGFCDNYGEFNNMGSIGFWWCSTETSSPVAWIPSAWAWSLSSYNSVLNRDDFFDKEHGFSARCIRDNS